MSTIRNSLLATAFGAALFASGAAYADPFQITPSVFGGPAGHPTATFIEGNSSELLTITSPTTLSGQGFVSLSTFDNGVNHVAPGTSGLGVNYGLYATFQLTATVTSGTNGAPGSGYILNSLSFQIFADPGLDTTFTAPVASSGTPPGVIVGTPDIFLGAGTLINPSADQARITSQGGAALNSTELLELCTGNGTALIGNLPVADPNCKNGDGVAFFSSPSPFYSVALDEFNNTLGGVTISGNFIAITDASGGIDFTIPEPATLALFGAGLLGLGLGLRRRRWTRG